MFVWDILCLRAGLNAATNHDSTGTTGFFKDSSLDWARDNQGVSEKLDAGQGFSV